MSGGGARQLTMQEALRFARVVKIALQDEKEKYEAFLDIACKFDPLSDSVADIIPRVKELLKGHSGLILGFNLFLPSELKIKLPLEDDQSPEVGVQDAIEFLSMVQARFPPDSDVYKSLIEMLRVYKTGGKSAPELYCEVVLLFQDHSDILHEFKKFLP